MKPIKHRNIRTARLKGVIRFSAWMILLCGMIFYDDSGAVIGLQTASANVQYGIQGQQAPELKLETWIDGDGERVGPIYLSDYRGKVIYLYFFQDW
jgi:hypothetical protein